jgi:hypothetical protein
MDKELNDAGFEFGVALLGIEITTLRFPTSDLFTKNLPHQVYEKHAKTYVGEDEYMIKEGNELDKQDEQVAVQLAATNLAIESSRQNASKEQELSKLNQATHLRLQEDRDREAEAEERQQQVERRKDLARAETVTKKAEMDTKVVQAAKLLALAEEMKAKEVALAKATADAESERIRAQGKRDAARLAAEGAIAATKEKNDAQLDFLKRQTELLRDNPGLVQLLQLQNDLLKTQAMTEAAATNPNVVLLTSQEGLEARRMNNGHAPQVPGTAAIMTNGGTNGTILS